jgi:hypothetical protein
VGVAGSKREAPGDIIHGGGGTRKGEAEFGQDRSRVIRVASRVDDKHHQANDLLGVALDNIVSYILRSNNMSSKSPWESCLSYQQKYYVLDAKRHNYFGNRLLHNQKYY